MKIDRKTWDEYITRLSRINKRAANEMQAFLDKLATEGGNRREEQIIERAFGLATKYGEASGAAACDFYDKIAAGTGHNVPPANPADTATFAETAKAIRGTIKNQSEAQVPSTVGRLVKQCSADTMLQNAARDGAQFAWIPSGDTCAFCLTLASRGWQSISKKAVRNGHAEHIHANCNCEYCVRFSEFETVEGYEPEKYREIYDNAEGDTPKEKINSIRRLIDSSSKNMPEPLSRSYVNHDELLFKNLKNVIPYKDYEDFGVHGVPEESLIEIITNNGQKTRYTAHDFADILRKDPEYHGGKIRLLSCGAGAASTGFAYQLSKELGVEVYAPTETLWVAENGELFVSDNEILAYMWYNNENIDWGIKQTGTWVSFNKKR